MVEKQMTYAVRLLLKKSSYEHYACLYPVTLGSGQSHFIAEQLEVKKWVRVSTYRTQPMLLLPSSLCIKNMQK